MKQFAPPGNLRASVVLGLAGFALLGPPASAQTLPLPSLEMQVTPESHQVTVDWTEVPLSEGRRVSNIVYNPWDFAGSSTVALVGSYVGFCDYRLRISKVPQDPGFARRTRFIYQIFENTLGTGAPVRSDTVHIVAPDVVVPFDASIAGNLGLSVSPNLGPVSGVLGTVAVSVRGVNSTLSATAGYFATARNAVASLAQGLQVRVAGPVDLSAIPDPLPPGTPDTTLFVTSPSQVFNIMDAMTISFAEGSAAPGDTVTWTAHYVCPPNGRIIADLEAFAGYHVWRSDLPDVNSFTLLGEIRQCPSYYIRFNNVGEVEETDLEFFFDPVGRRFTLIDRDIHDDFPYRYAVSTFDRGFLGNPRDLTFEGPLAESGKFYPARQTRDRTDKVYVVPNPYKRRSDFQERDAKVVFANLPTECTIRIFTESVEHVITLRHGPGESGSTSPTSREWNLRNDSGLPIAPGIYIFQIEGTNRYSEPGGGTVTEGVQQVGKLIIAR
jgi:hypothetical protein